jgi:uroporphyrin-III C-methyltransferase
MNRGTNQNGKVFLIGAGPGDPGLLTIKAAQAISASDILVYDYLVNPEILVHARQGVELVYVGKRAGEDSISQSEINDLLIQQARLGLIVGRLKGGDPFIFGRGGEEAEALVEAGVNWEVIPGISSGVAAASFAGIPLTHRDHASSVAFITGHDGRKQRQSIDWALAVNAADTLVIFMCGQTIAKIAFDLIRHGRAPSTPLAIIRWGTYQHQEVYSGTLTDIASKDDDSGELNKIRLAPPAIAIVGEVVKLRDKLHWFGHRAVDLTELQCEKV